MASGLSNLPPIDKLRGSEDYNDWKYSVQAYLEHEELWDCIEGTQQPVANTKKMARAKAKLILANYSHIRSETTPKGIWEALKKAFEDSGSTRKVGLLRTLISTQLSNCSSTDEYVNKICTTAQKLDSLGFKVKQEWIGALLLAGLPYDYRPMIMALESSGTAITGESVKTKLLQEVNISQNMGNSETAFFSKKPKGKYPNKNNKQVLRCYNYNKFEHISYACRAKKNSEKQESNYKAFFSSTTTGVASKSNTWYLDSGATDHMTPDKDLLINFKEIQASDVNAANIGTMTATGIGDVTIDVLVNGKKETIMIKNCLYIKGLTENLLSIYRIYDSGYSTTFKKGKCTIQNDKGVVADDRRRSPV